MAGGETGKVYLVGAGCGKADLVTVRGEELLKRCDAVVYDDLVDRALLAKVPKDARVLYMGKRQGRHSAAQGEICDTLIQLAREGRTVVRLKGGDPFVFGRGGEEMEALQRAGIPCEPVGGITSAVAIPATAGIPVTMRGTSQSLHIVTAHTADTSDGLPEDFDKLASLHGTTVLLMGLSRLGLIANRLVDAGMSEHTPVAVVAGGNAPRAFCIRGTLKDIARKAEEAKAQTPAVIVVGDAAALDFSCPSKGPLQGALVGLSGSEGMTARLDEAFRALGASTFVAQQSVLRPLAIPEPLGKTMSGGPVWLVFTSANGVREFFSRLREERVDLRRLASCRFAVVGPATRDALAQEGFEADLCPAVHTTRALGSALLEATGPRERILLLRSRQGSRELLATLAAERNVRDVHLYEATDDPCAFIGADALLQDADYIVFTSGEGVRMFLSSHSFPAGAAPVCIGEVSRSALGACAAEAIVASDTSIGEIVRAVEADWIHRAERK